ncbi:chaperone protein dnaJ 11, chloroplastic-like [Gastrolobium bilobum]|uniref:chaperone protein dnaJ 11, chloroplastic-like n=1 Tax=Gastrolobium bilobum TaxID=150636 RepID=UPI002AAFD100|nr:chaperone protein dnaJ 11, chloroplastic-like [Gastrolobium bilobum]
MPATFGLAALPSSYCFTSARFIRRPSFESANHRRLSIRSVAAEAGPVVTYSRRPAASHYEVLRVEKDASPTEIKSAYRSLAKLYHPDAVLRRSPETDGGDFIEICNAYETLSDPSARAMYDLSLAVARGGRNRPFSAPMSLNRDSGFYPTRKWETDQCW